VCPNRFFAEMMPSISQPFHFRVQIMEILDLEHRLAQVLQIFLGKEHLVKNRLISTLDKVIYFKGTIFLWSTKPLFTSQNRVEAS
jgi:hypothetical protein